MLAKDLMSGDIVMFDDEPVEIREFLGLEKCIVANKQCIENEAMVDDLEPMPINEEFLKENHWEHCGFGDSWKHPKDSKFVGLYSIEKKLNDYSFNVHSNTYNSIGYELTRVKYIHELQRILKSLKLPDAFNVICTPVDKLKLAQETLVKDSKTYQLLQEVIDELEENK